MSASDPSGFTIPYLFVGALGVRYDSATGLHYCRNRWLDAAGLQCFLSRDVIKSPNRYVYCHNAPTQYIDPNGRFPESPELRQTYRRLYDRWRNDYTASGDYLVRNRGGGLWSLCRMLHEISDSVTSNEDFLQLLQALFVNNSSVGTINQFVETLTLNQTSMTTLSESQMQGPRRAYAPGRRDWNHNYQDDVEPHQDQTHHLVAFIIAGYKHGDRVAEGLGTLLDLPQGNIGDMNVTTQGAIFGDLLRFHNDLDKGDPEKMKCYRRSWITSLCSRLNTGP